MAEERVTRGQFMRFFQAAVRRGPAGLRKDWLYSNLKPMVDNLEADLKDEGVLAQEPAKDAPQELKEQPAQQAPATVTDEPATTQAEEVKEEPAKKPAKTDLGETPKKPARKGQKNK